MEKRIVCKNCGADRVCLDSAYSKTIKSEYRDMFDNLDTGTLDKKIINISLRCRGCGHTFEIELQETMDLAKITIQGI